MQFEATGPAKITVGVHFFIFKLFFAFSVLLRMNKQIKPHRYVGRLFRFQLKVLRDFRRNQGLLLSGAIAYYTLLSIVPSSILALILLSHFIGEEQLFHTLSMYIEMIIPGYSATLTEQVRVFLDHRKVVGIIGFLVMLFFSSIAFTAIETAMSIIFFNRVRVQHRPFSFPLSFLMLICF